jgi:osmotically-inducible protein OsmY
MLQVDVKAVLIALEDTVKKLMLVLALLSLSAMPLLVGCSSLQAPPATDSSMSDEDIRSEIVNRLRDDHVTARTTFGVTVANGVATLSGVVTHSQIKARALAIAGGVPGVKQVVDGLQRF